MQACSRRGAVPQRCHGRRGHGRRGTGRSSGAGGGGSARSRREGLCTQGIGGWLVGQIGTNRDEKKGMHGWACVSGGAGLGRRAFPRSAYAYAGMGSQGLLAVLGRRTVPRGKRQCGGLLHPRAARGRGRHLSSSRLTDGPGPRRRRCAPPRPPAAPAAAWAPPHGVLFWPALSPARGRRPGRPGPPP